MDSVQTFFEAFLGYDDVPLLQMRLVVGFVFVVAVRNKLRDVPAFAEHNGLPVPVAWGLTFAEAAAAIGLIFGILTQLAALLVALTMVGSIGFHVFKWKSKYWAAIGGWEYDLMLFAMAVVILTVGGGDVAVYPLV